MTLKEKIQKAWENKGHILEGFYNEYISMDPEIKAEAARRLSICEANSCGYWDATGTSEKLVVSGKPGCTACGCEGGMKTSCMQCHCSLKDMGQEPLWDELITQDQAKKINEVTYQNQFKNRS